MAERSPILFAGSTPTLTVTGGGAFGGVISNGSGIVGLTVGGGTLTLSGANSYTGGTIVMKSYRWRSSAISTSLQGNIQDNGHVTFQQGDKRHLQRRASQEQVASTLDGGIRDLRVAWEHVPAERMSDRRRNIGFICGQRHRHVERCDDCRRRDAGHSGG